MSTQDSSCWLSRSRRVSCRRSNEGNLGRSRSHCGSYFTFCATRHSSYWPSKYTCKTSLVFFLHIIDSYMALFILDQTYVIFLAKLKNLHFAPGPESLECRLFALDEIPFDSLAFSSIYVTLNLVRI